MLIQNIKSPVAMACAGNLFLNMTVFDKAGQTSHDHMHLQDHFTFVPPGSAFEVIVDEKSKEFIGPCIVYVQKEKRHRFIALRDNSITCCMFALFSKDYPGEILDPSMIPEGVNPLRLAAKLSDYDDLDKVADILDKLDKTKMVI